MTQANVHDYAREVSCCYDGEHYLVRDNGAVLRQAREGKRLRRTDNLWTFGTADLKNGYMHIAQVRVHRIVATAFHGSPPAPEYVVDHIDTNRQNNRPENLHWLTRLENALLNPITLKRIEFICGSVEAFLADPSKLGQSTLEPNFKWMRIVSAEEAQACLERMRSWAQADHSPSGKGALGEWLFKSLPVKAPPKKVPTFASKRPVEDIKPPRDVSIPSKFTDDLVLAKTLVAAQRNWRTPSEFPACPQSTQSQPILTYAANLKPGVIFSHNDYSTHKVIESKASDDGQAIFVLSQSDGMKPWSVAQVTFEDGLFIHESCGSYFTEEGARKIFCLVQGLEWTGGDTFDDFC